MKMGDEVQQGRRLLCFWTSNLTCVFDVFVIRATDPSAVSELTAIRFWPLKAQLIRTSMLDSGKCAGF